MAITGTSGCSKAQAHESNSAITAIMVAAPKA
jgi:hypothetical protein